MTFYVKRNCTVNFLLLFQMKLDYLFHILQVNTYKPNLLLNDRVTRIKLQISYFKSFSEYIFKSLMKKEAQDKLAFPECYNYFLSLTRF